MKITKVRDVKTPTRGTSKSAGIDFFVPNDFPGSHSLAPGQSINIPSGVHVKVPEGHALVVMNKSGVALKKGLQVGACVIDEDYQGEVHIHVTNVSWEVTNVNPGEKLVQMLLIPVLYAEVCSVETLEDLYTEVSERGQGGFGSTGNGLEVHAAGEETEFRFPYEKTPVKVRVKETFTGSLSDNSDKFEKI